MPSHKDEKLLEMKGSNLSPKLKDELLDVKKDNSLLNQLYGGEIAQGDKYMDALIYNREGHPIYTPQAGILVAGLCYRDKEYVGKSKDSDASKNGPFVKLIKEGLTYGVDNKLIENSDQGHEFATAINRVLIDRVELRRKAINPILIDEFVKYFDQKRVKAILDQQAVSFDRALSDDDQAFMDIEKESHLYVAVENIVNEMTQVADYAQQFLIKTPKAKNIYHVSSKDYLNSVIKDEYLEEMLERFNIHLITSFIAHTKGEVKVVFGEYKLLQSLMLDCVSLITTYESGNEPNYQRVMMIENLLNKVKTICSYAVIANPDALSQNLLGLLKGIKIDIKRHHDTVNIVSRWMKVKGSDLYQGASKILEKYTGPDSKLLMQSPNLGISSESLRSSIGLFLPKGLQGKLGLPPVSRQELLDGKVVPAESKKIKYSIVPPGLNLEKEPENPGGLLNSFASPKPVR